MQRTHLRSAARVSVVVAIVLSSLAIVGTPNASANHCAFGISCHGSIPPNYYYAETFFDGVIHCAKAEGFVNSYAYDNSSLTFYGEFSGSTWQGPYCAYKEQAGVGWISVNVTLWRWNDGWVYPQFCTSTGWQSNANEQPGFTVSLGSRWYDPRLRQWRLSPYSVGGTACEGTGGRFQVQAEFYIARNLGNRYISLWTTPQVRGG